MENLQQSIDTIQTAKVHFDHTLRDSLSTWNDTASHEFIKIIQELEQPIAVLLGELQQLSALISKAHEHLEEK